MWSGQIRGRTNAQYISRTPQAGLIIKPMWKARNCWLFSYFFLLIFCQISYLRPYFGSRLQVLSVSAVWSDINFKLFSVIKRKEKDINKYKKNTEELHAEISKLHEQVISVQRQDISITMPTFERRNDNSDGSADELPETDQLEQNDSLDKLKQIGTMVTHFQQ